VEVQVFGRDERWEEKAKSLSFAIIEGNKGVISFSSPSHESHPSLH
jgi:hypothetical protein